MSKEELVSALSKSQAAGAEAEDEIKGLEHQLRLAQGMDKASEQARQAHEKKMKKKEKEAEKAKREKKLEQKEQLGDILMAHGAKFLAMRAAKKTASQGSTKQKVAVLAAAQSGARAGAVGPLKKVVRAAAVAAVKKARADAKKAGKHGKDEVRKLAVAAAQTAVNDLINKQDKMVKKVSHKWTKAAIGKFPPTILLAEHTDKPNVFVAPPSVHIDFGGVDEKQVEQLEEDSAGGKKNKKIAAAAAAAKQAAGKVVPEGK